MEVEVEATVGASNFRNKASSLSSSTSFRLRSSPSLNSVRLRRIFDLFDRNRDEFITLREIKEALVQLGLDVPDIADLESTVEAHIQPGNIGLTFDDFIEFHNSLDEAVFGIGDHAADNRSQEESDLTEAFKVFDEDGDGFISVDELQKVLKKLGLPEARDINRVKEMIISVDRNNDGRVDFFEFKNMMQGVLVRTA